MSPSPVVDAGGLIGQDISPEEAQGALPGELLLPLGLMVEPVIEPVEIQLELLK